MSYVLDFTLTLDNLTSLLEGIQHLNEVALWLHIPFTKQWELRAQSSGESQEKQAYWKYFLTQHPCPSWLLVAHALYRAGEHGILEVLQNKYISLDGQSHLVTTRSYNTWQSHCMFC